MRNGLKWGLGAALELMLANKLDNPNKIGVLLVSRSSDQRFRVSSVLDVVVFPLK